MAFSLQSLFPSFFRTTGSTLVDGGDMVKFLTATLGYLNGIVAHAGGGQSSATPISLSGSAAYVEVDTVASNNDSVLLPAAIPGQDCIINNMGANTLNIYSNLNNYANVTSSGTPQADVIVPHGSVTANTSTTAISLSSGHVTWFACTTLGQWKQVADFS